MKFKITIIKKDETPVEGIVEHHSPSAALRKFVSDKKMDELDFNSIFVSNVNV